MAAVAAPIRLRLKDNGRRLTLNEFLGAEKREGYRYELAGGVLEVSHFPDEEHGEIVSQLISSIGAYEREHPRLIAYAGGGADCRISIPGKESSRIPDVAVVLQNIPVNPRGDKIPYLAMEVVSKGMKERQRDFVTKREEYLAYGLIEYWIVDPTYDKIFVNLRNGISWMERVFQSGQTAEGIVLPGFQIDVAAIFDNEDE